MESWITSSVTVFVALALVSELLERWRPARRVNRLRHIVTDLGSFGFAVLLNRSIDALLAPVVAAHAPDSVAAALSGLRGLPTWAKIGLAVVIADFCLYWIHRAQHTWDWAWRTHAWHHSIEELYWFSGFRTSFLHSLVYNIPQVAIPVLLLGMGTFETAICFAIGMVIQFWEHVNWRVDLGKLDRVMVTPDYHRVHHSVTDRPQKNLAPTFSIWDRMFGTWVDPRTVPLETPLGIGEPIPKKAVPRMLAGV
ncbi:MAG: sterol desaturase family protein [Planctomycetota bacterium]|nr:sterol desaturase family protein [Planctomycetota bacterium]